MSVEQLDRQIQEAQKNVTKAKEQYSRDVAALQQGHQDQIKNKNIQHEEHIKNANQQIQDLQNRRTKTETKTKLVEQLKELQTKVSTIDQELGTQQQSEVAQQQGGRRRRSIRRRRKKSSLRRRVNRKRRSHRRR